MSSSLFEFVLCRIHPLRQTNWYQQTDDLFDDSCYSDYYVCYDGVPALKPMIMIIMMIIVIICVHYAYHHHHRRHRRIGIILFIVTFILTTTIVKWPKPTRGGMRLLMVCESRTPSHRRQLNRNPPAARAMNILCLHIAAHNGHDGSYRLCLNHLWRSAPVRPEAAPAAPNT